MSVSWPTPPSNQLLACLPPEEYRRLLPELEPIRLHAGEVLHQPGQAQADIIFPCAGIVSLNYRMEDGASVATALVGREGLVGISLFMDGTSTSNLAVVQTDGQGFRLGADVVRRALKDTCQLKLLALRYIQALITQMAQTAVCNRHHNLDQQICRWLLLSLDRHFGNELTMTQELIAQMLGVRREGVTAAAGKLQDAGVIFYSRGKIAVLDRPALEERVCECYGVVRREYERLLPVLVQARRHAEVLGEIPATQYP